MNYKQAKEITQRYKYWDYDANDPEFQSASSFIEAVDKFAPVVEALAKVINNHDGCEHATKDCSNDYCCVSNMAAVEDAKAALSAYRRDVIGEVTQTTEGAGNERT